jgi:hypothetical protein
VQQRKPRRDGAQAAAQLLVEHIQERAHLPDYCV